MLRSTLTGFTAVALGLAVAGASLAQSPVIQKSSPTGGDQVMANEAAANPPPPPATGQLWQRTEVTTDPNGIKTTTTIVASPPVPDTHENRARYGGPDSGGKLKAEERPVGK